MTPLLQTSGLRCGYGADEVIHGVDLVVSPGEIVTILGPNGCGKTTLVKAILGYVRTTKGSISFRGQDLTRLRPIERVARGIGYVPQLLNTFRPLTVTENLEIGGYRLRRQERSAAIQRMFALFPLLADRRGQRAATLSGGERQLLAMARALMVSPEMIILDEPSAGLSPLRADEVFQHVRAIAEAGFAVVIVEQDVHRALEVSARAYVLVTGLVAMHGPAAAVAADERIRAAYLGARETFSPGRVVH
ncbi:MAG: ABC transporter ATP-binding protein [Bradyrhizobium sp.]|uniref:ABC transporter ATP-binding protein n=1 Tax=Bradyrhizobium sp. TaxID=376 RepID=UPI001D391F4D|nr:ABC transporter ATP-binding protein [Bradyrhizobium sp.]MBV9559477.1 ABC transporter ATP-binding protein [Bradyrhizobium sp.]